ncbi:MAG: RES family NAD+ phosphorylase [Proteobacteria bacterium]|nr:RES family NAD+ phosphorylase [Pseudomonadota bacterium]
MTADLPPVRRVRWAHTYRIIPSRYPPVDLFERVADPADLEAIAIIEGMTNDRIRDSIGNISLVPVKDRISGPGASPVMAAFTHIGYPSRFTDGKHGVYYAGNRIEVALNEVAFHLTKFYSATSESSFRSDHRTYIGTLNKKMHDIRGGWSAEHNPDSYVASQSLGRLLREQDSNGIAYDSVRHPGGQCIAAFKPRVVGSVAQGPHFYLQWNGERLERFIRVGESQWSPFPA